MTLTERIKVAPDNTTIIFQWKSQDGTQSGEDFYRIDELRALIEEKQASEVPEVVS